MKDNKTAQHRIKSSREKLKMIYQDIDNSTSVKSYVAEYFEQRKAQLKNTFA